MASTVLKKKATKTYPLAKALLATREGRVRFHVVSPDLCGRLTAALLRLKLHSSNVL